MLCDKTYRHVCHQRRLVPTHYVTWPISARIKPYLSVSFHLAHGASLGDAYMYRFKSKGYNALYKMNIQYRYVTKDVKPQTTASSGQSAQE